MTTFSDINNVGQSLSTITTNINQYVVAPLAAFGIGGFVFNAVGEAMANLSADITDHYTEDNRAIQDQIAIRPKRITLKGYVGEVIYNGPGSSPSTLNTLTQKLTALTSFLPTLTASATQVQELVTNPATASFSSVLGTASNIYGLVQNTLGAFGPMQNQQNAYSYFKALMQSATLMGIQTPWEFMTSMAIENITAIQPENSQWITDFSITLKEIRIAQTANGRVTNASGSMSSSTNSVSSNQSFVSDMGSSGVPATQADIAAIQSAAPTNLGNIPGQNIVEQQLRQTPEGVALLNATN